MARPLLIAVGGMSGSGKTSLAAALANNIPNAIHLDSDRTRKEMFGVAPTDRLPSEAYTDEATQRLIAVMDERVKAGLAAGKTVIVSAAFLPPESRAMEENLAKSCGVEFRGLWLEADVQTLCDRAEKRTGDASDAGAAVIQLQAGIDKGVISWPAIDASKAQDHILKEALALIDKGRGSPFPAGPRMR